MNPESSTNTRLDSRKKRLRKSKSLLVDYSKGKASIAAESDLLGSSRLEYSAETQSQTVTHPAPALDSRMDSQHKTTRRDNIIEGPVTFSIRRGIMDGANSCSKLVFRESVTDDTKSLTLPNRASTSKRDSNGSQRSKSPPPRRKLRRGVSNQSSRSLSPLREPISLSRTDSRDSLFSMEGVHGDNKETRRSRRTRKLRRTDSQKKMHHSWGNQSWASLGPKQYLNQQEDFNSSSLFITGSRIRRHQ